MTFILFKYLLVCHLQLPMLPVMACIRSLTFPFPIVLHGLVPPTSINVPFLAPFTEDGESMAFQTVGILPHHYIVS